jgi:hypothetical protein
MWKEEEEEAEEPVLSSRRPMRRLLDEANTK